MIDICRQTKGEHVWVEGGERDWGRYHCSQCNQCLSVPYLISNERLLRAALEEATKVLELNVRGEHPTDVVRVAKLCREILNVRVAKLYREILNGQPVHKPSIARIPREEGTRSNIHPEDHQALIDYAKLHDEDLAEILRLKKALRRIVEEPRSVTLQIAREALGMEQL